MTEVTITRANGTAITVAGVAEIRIDAQAGCMEMGAAEWLSLALTEQTRQAFIRRETAVRIFGSLMGNLNHAAADDVVVQVAEASARAADAILKVLR